MSEATFELPRRQPSARRGQNAIRLLEAVPGVIAETGYDGLTVRGVAAAAGVSGQTAYNYFSSKEHLVASVFLHRLATQPPFEVDVAKQPLRARVEAATASIALAVADEPELSAGVTTALLAHDVDVVAVRDQIGTTFAERLALACGDDVPAEAQFALTAMLIGTLLMAGLQTLDYHALPGILAGFSDLIQVRPERRRPAARRAR